MFNKIRLMSIPIKNEEFEMELYRINFPEKLKAFVEEKYKESIEYKNEPDKSLKTLLYHNFSDIVYIDTISYRMNCNNWIFSDKEIDLDEVKFFLKRWFVLIYGKEDMLDTWVNEMKCEKFNLIIDFGRKCENGTANPSSEVFTVFLSYIGKRLANDFNITIGDRKCDFHLVTPIYNNKIELIANPQKIIDLNDLKSLWMHKITLRIETNYKQGNAMLHIQPSLLRLCYDPVKIRYNKKSTNSYIFVDRNKYSGEGKPHYISVDLNKNNKALMWDSRFMKILKEINLDKNLPNAAEVGLSPKNYILNKAGFPIIVPFGSHLYGRHKIKSGLSMNDRHIIETLIMKELINNYNIFIDEKTIIDRVQLPNKDNMDIVHNTQDVDEGIFTELQCLFKELNDQEVIANQDLINIRKSKIVIPSKKYIEMFPQEIKINIFFKDLNWRELVKASLIFNCMLKAVDLSKNIFSPISYPDKIVIINEINISDWDFISGAYDGNEVIKSIKDELDERKNIELALFELEDDDYYMDCHDPKFYIRAGLASRNILTQFITPINKEGKEGEQIDKEIAMDSLKYNIEEIQEILRASRIIYSSGDTKNRFKKSVLDIFRQYGIHKNSMESILSENQSTAYVGLYIYYVDSYNKGKNKGIPIMVMLNNRYGLMMSFNGSDWMNYREGQVKLAEIKNKKEELDISKINDPLVKLKNRYNMKHIILFVDGYKLRSKIPYFQNNFMNDNVRLTIGKDCNVELSNEYSSVNSILSIIRIRDEGSGEIPDWVAYDEEDKPESLPGGLFKRDENTYYSIAQKPNMAAKKNGDLKEVNSAKMYRKETAVELCIPCVKDGVNKDELAAVAHKLRIDLALQFDEFTSYMYPLHLAELAKEYLE